MKQINELIRAFNTLLMVKTCGDDTIIMGQCLSVMRQNLLQLEQLLKNQEELKENG